MGTNLPLFLQPLPRLKAGDDLSTWNIGTGCKLAVHDMHIYIYIYIDIHLHVKHEIIYCNRDTSVYIHTCCQAFSNWDCSTRVSTCLDAKVYITSVYVVMT